MHQLIIASIFVVTWGSQVWLMQAVRYYNKAYPGKCYINEKAILAPGEKTRSPTECSDIVCSNEKGDTHIMECGYVMEPEHCRWNGSENVELDYPLCCLEKFVCDDPDHEEQGKMWQEKIRDLYTRKWKQRRNIKD